MEKRLYYIKYERRYCENILKLFKEKTTLNYSQTILILDFFSFLIRKTVIETGEINIYNFGKFYLKKFKSGLIKPRFRSSLFFRHKINGTFKREQKQRNRFDQKTHSMLVPITTYLNINPRNTLFLFTLYINGIINELKENRVIKLRGIGAFELYYCSIKNNKAIKNPENRVVSVKFHPLAFFLNECYYKKDYYRITPILKKLIDYCDISTKVENYYGPKREEDNRQ